MKEIVLYKTQDGGLRAATAADQELLESFKLGQGVKVKAVGMKPRSLPHHRLYWGGLLELAFDYWEPQGGLISASEKGTLLKFADWLDRKGGNSGAVRRACKAFLTELKQSRTERIETPHKSKQGLHEWVKIEAGYFDYEITPTGIRKVARSINFNSMGQEEFTQFYKAAFSVVWRFILSRNFESEQQAQNAVDQLVAMG